PTAGPSDGPNTVRVAGGLAYALGHSDPNVSGAGLSLAASFEHRYLTVDFLELGATLNVLVDRFSTGTDESGNTTFLTANTFSVLQTAAVRADRWRFWLGVGAGVALGGARTSTLLAQAALGVELTLKGRSAVALLGDFTRPLRSPVGTDGLSD